MTEKELPQKVDATIEVNGKPVPLELHAFGDPRKFPPDRTILIDEELRIAASFPSGFEVPKEPHLGEIQIFDHSLNGHEVEE